MEVHNLHSMVVLKPKPSAKFQNNWELLRAISGKIKHAKHVIRKLQEQKKTWNLFFGSGKSLKM